MSEAVRLIPLQCPRCSMAVPAQVDEVAWVCAQCGQGMLLSSSEGTLELDVFFSAAISPGATGRPYWVARGVVNPLDRLTYRGNASEEMKQFWSVPRLFYVPAYQLPIEEIVALGLRLLRQPVRMDRGTPTRFLPVVLSPENIRPVSEFIVMSAEAERKDALRELKFDIRLDPPQLWILPS